MTSDKAREKGYNMIHSINRDSYDLYNLESTKQYQKQEFSQYDTVIVKDTPDKWEKMRGQQAVYWIYAERKYFLDEQLKRIEKEKNYALETYQKELEKLELKKAEVEKQLQAMQ